MIVLQHHQVIRKKKEDPILKKEVRIIIIKILKYRRGRRKAN